MWSELLSNSKIVIYLCVLWCNDIDLIWIKNELLLNKFEDFSFKELN